ncbi:hypothetical protein XELAEV_18015798mg [Xenopus laevis]|uniref:Uncharacterized protein n=1 Tax=Xenopus laevis TaxID=8355 RepID=A0A974DL14_XENLA|nr:hypothetical protein XELAEV_18015798mg [Xenopus laevis]
MQHGNEMSLSSKARGLWPTCNPQNDAISKAVGGSRAFAGNQITNCKARTPFSLVLLAINSLTHSGGNSLTRIRKGIPYLK